MPKPPGGQARGKGSAPAGFCPAAGGFRSDFKGALIFPAAEQDQSEISPERGGIGGRHAARCFHLAQGCFQITFTHQIPERTVQRWVAHKPLVRGFAFFRGGAGIFGQAFLGGRSRQAGPARRRAAEYGMDRRRIRMISKARQPIP